MATETGTSEAPHNTVLLPSRDALDEGEHQALKKRTSGAVVKITKGQWEGSTDGVDLSTLFDGVKDATDTVTSVCAWLADLRCHPRWLDSLHCSCASSRRAKMSQRIVF